MAGTAATQLVSDSWLTGGVGGAVRSVYSAYNDILSKGDPRVEGLFLMGSPLPTIIMCLTYVWVVKVAGPKFMEKRAPYELKNVMIVYNFLQILFSTWIFYEFGMGGWLRGYSYTCQPVDYSDSAIGHRMLHASYWYFLSKFTEFFDTLFFVLRKKNQHVSLLHVLHHGCMPFSSWTGVKFTPGGHSTFFGFLNTFVHIIMYTYYMLAAMGPQYQKYIWWKKHLTSMQIIQFVMIFFHAFQLCFRDCDYPKVFVWWIGGHAVLFFFLFSNFYVKAYRMRMTSKAESKAGQMLKMVPCFLPGSDEVSKQSLPNGYTNGHANGHANGYTNGHANGHVVSSDTDARLRRPRKDD